MLQIIGILLLSGQLSVAVQSAPGSAQYHERNFPCEDAAMEPLFDFVMESLGAGEPAIHFVIGPVEQAESCGALFRALAENGIGNGAVAQAELDAFARGQQPSGRLVAEAFRGKHARLLRR